MKIIVTGSLGNISKPLAQALVDKGHDVVVISSNAEKQKDIEAMGAVAAIGSLADSEFLAITFKGADKVYAMIPPDYTTADPLAHYHRISTSYANAIQQSGIKNVVFLSSWGAHLEKGTGVIVGSHNAEQTLNKLPGVSITYLRPASFYTNLFHYIDMIKTAGLMGTNYGGDDKLVMVAATDIADAAVEELEAKKDARSIRYIASDEHSCNEIATALGKAIGKPDLKWLTFSDEQTRASMEKNGVPSYMAGKLVELNASIRTGLIREDYDLHPPAAMGKIKLDDFAKEFAIAFDIKS